MKNFKIASVLTLITLVCAALIAGVYMLTYGTIQANSENAAKAAIQEVYPEYDETIAQELSLEGKDAAIKKIIDVNPSATDKVLLYTVSGSNSYGGIELLVKIENNTVTRVVFISNTESYASTVNSHVANKYPYKDSTIYVGVKPEMGNVESLDSTALAGIDTKCGATYGAQLVKDIVTIALNDAKRVN